MARVFSLTEAASIALHGMVIIARNNKTHNVTEIANEIGSSKHHVAKVLQRLVKDELLISQRGPSGGFKIAKEPKEISLLQIYESIEGSIEISACPLDHDVCPFGQCIMGSIATKMTKDFKDYLENMTLDKYV